jgi:hypothetical protein
MNNEVKFSFRLDRSVLMKFLSNYKAIYLIVLVSININCNAQTIKVAAINWCPQVCVNEEHPEDYDVNISGQCTLPILNISNLKLDGEGDNFSSTETLLFMFILHPMM